MASQTWNTFGISGVSFLVQEKLILEMWSIVRKNKRVKSFVVCLSWIYWKWNAYLSPWQVHPWLSLGNRMIFTSSQLKTSPVLTPDAHCELVELFNPLKCNCYQLYIFYIYFRHFLFKRQLSAHGCNIAKFPLALVKFYSLSFPSW